MQLRQPTPDALVSFSDFLLERFGLVASMQAALIGSIAIHQQQVDRDGADERRLHGGYEPEALEQEIGEGNEGVGSGLPQLHGAVLRLS